MRCLTNFRIYDTIDSFHITILRANLPSIISTLHFCIWPNFHCKFIKWCCIRQNDNSDRIYVQKRFASKAEVSRAVSSLPIITSYPQLHILNYLPLALLPTQLRARKHTYKFIIYQSTNPLTIISCACVYRFQSDIRHLTDLQPLLPLLI